MSTDIEAARSRATGLILLIAFCYGPAPPLAGLPLGRDSALWNGIVLVYRISSCELTEGDVGFVVVASAQRIGVQPLRQAGGSRRLGLGSHTVGPAATGAS